MPGEEATIEMKTGQGPRKTPSTRPRTSWSRPFARWASGSASSTESDPGHDAASDEDPWLAILDSTLDYTPPYDFRAATELTSVIQEPAGTIEEAARDGAAAARRHHGPEPEARTELPETLSLRHRLRPQGNGRGRRRPRPRPRPRALPLAESRDMLCARLDAAALMLGLILTLWLARGLFLPAPERDVVLLLSQAWVLVALGIIHLWLSNDRDLSGRQLRMLELAVFGAFTALLALGQWRLMLQRYRAVRRHGSGRGLEEQRAGHPGLADDLRGLHPQRLATRGAGRRADGRLAGRGRLAAAGGASRSLRRSPGRSPASAMPATTS